MKLQSRSFFDFSCLLLITLLTMAPTICCDSFLLLSPIKPFQPCMRLITKSTSSVRNMNCNYWHLRSNSVTNSNEIEKKEEKEEVVVVESKNDTGISKSTDPEYPYQFTGRLWFSPSLVKIPNEDNVTTTNQLVSKNVQVLSLFGYTLGGKVTLEYDTSPVGPYKEYVTMSSLVFKNGSIGQWGSRLYVSTQEAEDVCKQVWGVPAEVANIEFNEKDSPNNESSQSNNNTLLKVSKPPCPDSQINDLQNIIVEGWGNTRILTPNEYDVNGNASRYGNVPVLWTPTIKALWSPWVAGGILSHDNDKSCSYGGESNSMKELPLHKLRLSASAIRLSWSGLTRRLVDNVSSETEESMGIPLGVGLVVDNVLIEIGSQCGML